MVNGHGPHKVTPKINTYIVVERAIEEGLQLGYDRSHKHTMSPSTEVILDQQLRAIMEKLDEVMKF